mmetsp:Transcript_96138/g.220384  ORF Transcript_96138/g.220384 Transcript_96138/m.220384 type:complete len:164 (-) Transcript_96138:32-523(-)
MEHTLVKVPKWLSEVWKTQEAGGLLCTIDEKPGKDPVLVVGEGMQVKGKPTTFNCRKNREGAGQSYILKGVQEANHEAGLQKAHLTVEINDVLEGQVTTSLAMFPLMNEQYRSFLSDRMDASVSLKRSRVVEQNAMPAKLARPSFTGGQPYRPEKTERRTGPS